MALQSQLVEVPITGGVNEKQSPRLGTAMRTRVNCKQLKTGALAKRFGSTCVGQYNARYGGSTIPTCELLTTRRDELLRVGGGQLDTYASATSTTDWVFRDYVPNVLTTFETIAGGGTVETDSDVAYAGGYVFHISREYAYDVAVATFTIKIFLDVLSASTGARVLSRYELDSVSANRLSTPKIAYIPGAATVQITWIRNFVIYYSTVTIATMAVGAPTILIGALSTEAYDISALSDRVAIAYQQAGGIGLDTYGSTFALITSVLVTADAAADAIAVRGTTAETLYVAWARVTGGAFALKYRGYAPATLVASFAATVITSSGAADDCYNIGIERLDATNVVVTWSITPVGGDGIAAYWRQATNAGTFPFASDLCPHHYFISKPWLEPSTGRVYAVIANNHAVASTAFVAALYIHADSPTQTASLRMVSTFAPRQINTAYSAARFHSSLSNVPLGAAAGTYYAAFLTSGAQYGTLIAALATFTTRSTKPVAAYGNGLTVFAGGVPTAYDGDTAFELGFAYEPDTSGVTAVAGGAGGSLTTNSRYLYLLVYEWRTANGLIVRSPVSDPANPFVFDSGANTKATVSFRRLNLTNKQAALEKAHQVQIVLYRTVANGATYYRCTAPQVPLENQNDPGSSLIGSVVDTLADTTLATRPFLYTTGGVPNDEIPPSSAFVAVIDGRVWLAGTDDDRCWYSTKLVDGEAPRFSQTRIIPQFEGGRVVAVSSVGDGNTVLFKSDSMYLIVGDGPNVTNTDGGFSDPKRIPGDVGCVDARSVVVTPMGVEFLSRDGLVTLTRQLEIVRSGKPIEDTLGASTIASAVFVADQNEVRFGVAGSRTVLVRDLFHANEWGASVYRDPSLSNAETVSAACYWRGVYTFINSSGYLYNETKSDWRDERSAVYATVTMRARTRPIWLNTIQGFQRVREVAILGDKRSNHGLTVTVYSDEDTDSSTSRVWAATEVNAVSRYQFQVHVAAQLCQAVSIEVADDGTLDGGLTVGTGESATFSSIVVNVGVKSGSRRLPATQAK